MCSNFSSRKEFISVYFYCADFAPYVKLMNKQVLVLLHTFCCTYGIYIYIHFKVILKEKYTLRLIFYAVSSKIKMPFIFNDLTYCDA